MNTSKLTSGRHLARNSITNLIGLAAPMFVAFFTIPILIRNLGTERFGVLNLAWMVIGYFSLFDMGISRALTKFVAEKLGTDAEQEVSSIVSTGVLLMLLLGSAGAIVCWVVSPWLVYSILKIPPALQSETLRAFYILSLSLPIVISTAGLRGVLEAYQRFDLVNYIRVPMGIFSYIGPLLAAVISNDLATVVAILLVGRLIAWGVHLFCCLRIMPGLRGNLNPRRKVAGRLIAFGGWMTISNIITPLMGSFGRFMLGAMVSVSAVAYFSTPYEMVTKMWILPNALTGVLFPAFSASFARDKGRCELLYLRGLKYIFLSLFPLVLIIVTFAAEGMTLWLGREFSVNSYKTLQWLAAGVFVNCISHIPATLINGCGRPDITMKLNMLELPFFLAGAWFLTSRYGINGMAMAWALRTTCDSLMLFMIVRRFLTNLHDFGWFALRSLLLPLCLFAVAASLTGFLSKMLFLALVLGIFALVVWRSMLVEDEKTIVCKYLRLSRL